MIHLSTDYFLAAELLKGGMAPFWAEKLSCGTPLFATPGLGLAYPGILLILHSPGPLSWLAFWSLHLALAFGAIHKLAGPAGRGRGWQAAVLAAVAAAGLYGGPAAAAAAAWLLWVLALERGGHPRPASRALAWAFLILAGMPWAVLAGLAGAAWFGAWRRLGPASAAGLGGLLAAGWLLPALEAMIHTRPSPVARAEAGAYDEWVARRGERVALAAGQDPAAHSPARVLAAHGYHLSWGARRETSHMKLLGRLLRLQGPDSPGIHAAMGAAWAYDGRQAARLGASARVALVEGAKLRGSGQDALKLETKTLFQRPLILEQELRDPKGQESGGGTWTLLSDRPRLDGSLDLELPAGRGAGWLFTSDTWYPGWSAKVDGQARPLYRAERAFRALALRQGERKVHISYRCDSFRLGLGISLLAMLFLLRPDRRMHLWPGIQPKAP